jgi:PPOX class probable FMN-dependent enzyme
MIEALDELRRLYAEPSGRAVTKQLSRLDPHCTRFISLSPFVVLASAGHAARLDASPRGGDAGFVKVSGDRTILIPDATGNNRLDTLTNILETGRLGLLFLIPGIDETLRVNGGARLSDDPRTLAVFAGERKTPKLVIEVTVEEAYLHCAKALMRSSLWNPQSRVQRSVLPSMGEMLRDQTGSAVIPEAQEQMVARYAAILEAEK